MLSEKAKITLKDRIKYHQNKIRKFYLKEDQKSFHQGAIMAYSECLKLLK